MEDDCIEQENLLEEETFRQHQYEILQLLLTDDDEDVSEKGSFLCDDVPFPA